LEPGLGPIVLSAESPPVRGRASTRESVTHKTLLAGAEAIDALLGKKRFPISSGVPKLELASQGTYEEGGIDQGVVAQRLKRWQIEGGALQYESKKGGNLIEDRGSHPEGLEAGRRNFKENEKTISYKEGFSPWGRSKRVQPSPRVPEA